MKFLFIPIILSILFYLAKLEKPKKLENGIFVSESPLSMKLAIMGSLSVLILFLSYAIVTNYQTSTIKDWIAFMVLLDALLIVLFFSSFALSKNKMIFSENEIILKTLFTGTQKCLWNEIKHVYYSKQTKCFEFKTFNKKRLKISVYISGLDEFLRIMKAQLPEHAYSKALVNFKNDPYNKNFFLHR